jgi:hypothetical protein
MQRDEEDKTMWIATCVCGHEEEEHEGGYGACMIEGCPCADYEPEGELGDVFANDEEEGDDGLEPSAPQTGG